MPHFHDLVEVLTSTTDLRFRNLTERYRKLLTYNVPKGKRLRVRATVTAYKILETPKNLTAENLRLAFILGWCVEMLNGFYLIIDDIEDGSLDRRGSPCWYLVEGIGMNAILDGFVLENFIFQVLKKFFSHHKCYVQAIEVFHLASVMSTLGQTLDTERPRQKNGICDLNFFSSSRYNAIAKYKTNYYTVLLPVILALHLAGKIDLLNDVKSDFRVLNEMGFFFQVQNDFLDCFGDSSITGKLGTDIEEAKCTWLMVTALQRANASQKKVLEENYGKKDQDNVVKVRKMYEELKVPDAYYQLENYSLNLFRRRTHETILPDILFEKLTKLFCKKLTDYGV